MFFGRASLGWSCWRAMKTWGPVKSMSTATNVSRWFRYKQTVSVLTRNLSCENDLFAVPKYAMEAQLKKYLETWRHLNLIWRVLAVKESLGVGVGLRQCCTRDGKGATKVHTGLAWWKFQHLVIFRLKHFWGLWRFFQTLWGWALFDQNWPSLAFAFQVAPRWNIRRSRSCTAPAVRGSSSHPLPPGCHASRFSATILGMWGQRFYAKQSEI